MNAIKKKRLEIGLKQKAVAKKMNVSPRTLRRYEQGETLISKKRLELLAQIFNCSIEELKGDGKDV